MDRTRVFAFTLLACLFTFLAIMGLQSTRVCRTIPDSEYTALTEQGYYPCEGVVSETQNTVTLWSSFGLIGLATFLLILTIKTLTFCDN